MTSGTAAWGAALLRVVLGAIFVMHGYLAFSVLGPGGAAGYIVRMGYPAVLAEPLAWYLIVVHGVGGLTMIVGLWTRIVAVLQVPIMASVLFLYHFAQGFFMRGILIDSPGGPQTIAGGYEYPLLVLAATIAVALLGPGAWSLDERRAAAKLVVP